MVLCNFSERTRCSVGAWTHLRTCFLCSVLFFLVDVCILVSLAVVVFCRLLIPLSCLRCTWSDFILTTVSFSVWDTLGNTHLRRPHFFVCGSCHFPIFSVLHGGCIFPSLRPWLNGCAAGSPFGFCLVTTSRNLICALFKLGKFGWWVSRPTETLQSRCCGSLHFSRFFLVGVPCHFFFSFCYHKKIESKKKNKNMTKKYKSKISKNEPPRRGTSPPFRDVSKTKSFFFFAKMVSEIVQQLRPTNTIQKKKQTNKK